MPAYDYRCRECDTSFEVRRSMTEPAPDGVLCPAGHAQTSRVFSAVAVGRGASASSSASAAAMAAAPSSGGSCCGGGCCG
ncbi:zinc ribbon domain-containing protein [Frankia sp. Ag45/Mut15]|uniref:Zinc ribbon domain-containing protein n=1 Tax=Frankia umida TaxID=573489 RepID=A0ABT0JVQ2_9ACTN|nr:zinc ribbon domain-containing protein [Frankia umida]MCK9875627.1 zinc ribbon domain-containing protein [Frankia umida]